MGSTLNVGRRLYGAWLLIASFKPNWGGCPRVALCGSAPAMDSLMKEISTSEKIFLGWEDLDGHVRKDNKGYERGNGG